MIDFFTTNIVEIANYLVNPNQRLFWGYLVSALCLAIWAYWKAAQAAQASEEKKVQGIWAYLFPAKVFWAKSARNDYLLFICNKFIKAALFPTIIITMVPVALGVSGAIEWLFGYREPFAWSAPQITLTFTLMLFVFDDFTRFLLHYLLHRIPMLWEFHKVHHSATVLTPMTVYRSHPVENYLYACRMALTQGTVVGICYYFFGPTLKMIDILGANVFVFAFNVMGSNLRHSHIWLSWGDKVEGWFLSPAQHQIHHSDNVKHFDTNFGTALAIWDRMAGCFIRASEVEHLTFGVGKSGEKHNTLRGIYWDPFKQASKKIKSLFTASKRKKAEIE